MVTSEVVESHAVQDFPHNIERSFFKSFSLLRQAQPEQDWYVVQKYVTRKLIDGNGYSLGGNFKVILKSNSGLTLRGIYNDRWIWTLTFPRQSKKEE